MIQEPAGIVWNRDGSAFKDSYGDWYYADGTAQDHSGNYYDENWQWHEGLGNHRQARHHHGGHHHDHLLADFENQLDEEDDYADDDPLYQEFLKSEGKFEASLKKHSYPLSVVIRDLPEQLDPNEFAEYLRTHKISHIPQLHRGEAVFKVNSEDDAHAFLEIVGGKYKNKKIVLSV